MDINDLYIRLRKVKNVTHFAKSSGVSRRTIQRFAVRSHNPSLETLLKIERQLNIDVPVAKKKEKRGTNED